MFGQSLTKKGFNMQFNYSIFIQVHLFSFTFYILVELCPHLVKDI